MKNCCLPSLYLLDICLIRRYHDVHGNKLTQSAHQHVSKQSRMNETKPRGKFFWRYFDINNTQGAWSQQLNRRMNIISTLVIIFLLLIVCKETLKFRFVPFSQRQEVDLFTCWRWQTLIEILCHNSDVEGLVFDLELKNQLPRLNWPYYRGLLSSSLFLGDYFKLISFHWKSFVGQPDVHLNYAISSKLFSLSSWVFVQQIPISWHRFR